MKLDDLRTQIDLIDKKLVALLEKRFDLAKDISKVKREQNLPVLNKERENEVLDKVSSLSSNYKDETSLVFSYLMDISKEIQER